MLPFWILAALMAAVAVAFVVVPLLRSRASGAAPTSAEANLDVLRSQRRELDADVAAGVLPASARDEALGELVERAATDIAVVDRAVETPRKPWALAIAAALAVPLLAFGLYLAIGRPQAADPAVLAAMKSPPPDDRQIVELVEALARKVRERPDDAKGWGLLARSMSALGRFDEAAEAYSHLAKLQPDDPQVLADYADVLGMAQGRTLAGKPYELAQQALRIDPDHPKALALAGTAALDAGDYPRAYGHWQRLYDTMPAESQDRPQVQAVLGEIRERAAKSGKPLPAAKVASPGKPPAVAAAPSAPAAAAGSVTGSVSVAPEIAARIKGSETLFVYARAENGPRMPLAIVRASARELPLKFALDDTQAMSPAMKLSGASAVRVEARVSASGNATPQAGDLVGTSAVVKPGARDVRIVVDKVVP